MCPYFHLAHYGIEQGLIYHPNQLNNILQDKTALVIAHRLSTINKLDRLVVMENGKVVEMGTHKSLIKKGGHYSKLWSLQSGGFLPTL